MTMTSLNIGCGRNPVAGMVNIDAVDLPGVDLVFNMDDCSDTCRLPFDDSSVDYILMSHVVEHLRTPLPAMQELWRVAKPKSTALILCPHGSSDDAWEDPTHIRAMFSGSFGYFSQPYYWRADYGYRGDWQIEDITYVMPHKYKLNTTDQNIWYVYHSRNTVLEMRITLAAVKPARAPLRELQQYPGPKFRFE